jgi:hypothetical protein
MQRQLLASFGKCSVAEVVRTLCGVQAQVASSAELAIRLRQAASRRGEVGRALSEGSVIKTWAMRGTLHLVAPEVAGSFLSLLAAGRSWERPSWERHFGMTARHWGLLRPAVREALAGAALTREELATAVSATRGLRHAGEALRSGWGTLLKPLAWQGDLCFGPSQGSRVTFTRPELASSRWAGVPEPEAAAPLAIAAYLSAYGPASAEGFSNWLSRGRVGKRLLRTWFAALGDRVTEIELEGQRAYVLREHIDELASAPRQTLVRLLPGFDQWVLGPGTDDPHIVPPARRPLVSKQSGWIAPTVVADGVVCATWQLDACGVRVAWFREAIRPPRVHLKAEIARLGSIVGRELSVAVDLV